VLNKNLSIDKPFKFLGLRYWKGKLEAATRKGGNIVYDKSEMVKVLNFLDRSVVEGKLKYPDEGISRKTVEMTT
jgi:hypothetical protein